MMRILVFSSLAADTGSAVRARYLAGSLKKSQARVEFVAPFPRTLPLKADFLLSLPWYLFKIIFTPADLIVAVKSYPNIGIPLLLARLFRKKVVIDTDDLAYAYTQGLWSFVSKISQEIFLPLANLHTTHNQALANYLKSNLNISAQKIYLLKQGVDADLFRKITLEKPEKLKKGLGLEGKKILLFVGHFDAACDLEKIFEGLPAVFKKFPEARLLIVGDGPCRNQLKNLARNLGIWPKLVWTGLVPKGKVADFITLSDVCLVYYQDKKANYFRVSLKLREYLALGKKVVCNDIGDLEEFARYTYQTSSHLESFSRMIIEVLKGQDDGRELEGKAYVLKNYPWPLIGLDFAKMLRKQFDND